MERDGHLRVRSLAREILALSEPERQEFAREVLPVLLTTRAGLAEIDASLRDLSDDELRALVERARQRASDLSEARSPPSSPRGSGRPVLTAVLDTQIILRGAFSATSSITARIYAAWTAGRFTLLLSEPILTEVDDVLLRPEVMRKLRMTPVDAAAVIELLRRQSTLVTPSVRFTLSRDPDDDKFLKCAAAGRADYIVGADADLLSLAGVQSIPIVDAPTFWRTLLRDA
jgi:putative PIN family toxin of toxin-antitoxin system